MKQVSAGHLILLASLLSAADGAQAAPAGKTMLGGDLWAEATLVRDAGGRNLTAAIKLTNMSRHALSFSLVSNPRPFVVDNAGVGGAYNGSTMPSCNRGVTGCKGSEVSLKENVLLAPGDSSTFQFIVTTAIVSPSTGTVGSLSAVLIYRVVGSNDDTLTTEQKLKLLTSINLSFDDVEIKGPHR